MSDNQDIETLLKNIQQGLQMYSVNELNDAIIKALSDKHDKTEVIQYVITIVCNYYDISEYALKNISKRGYLQEAKQIVYCLLYYNVGLSIRYIAKSIFGTNWHTSVTNGINRYKESDIQLKQDREFIEKYSLLRNKLLLFIKEQEKQIV
jgi:chromosomal replication initiation ATPase DnaA